MLKGGKEENIKKRF